MTPEHIPALVLRAPHGPAVVHLIIRIPEACGEAAARTLLTLKPTFGPQASPALPCCSIGFSFAGLEALGVPEAYLRLFRHQSPAYAEGAVRRSVRLGDAGPSAAQRWHPGFRQDTAHALVSWHGELEVIRNEARLLAESWRRQFGVWLPDPFEGARIGAPNKRPGEEWVHFGYRDGISEVCIDKASPRPLAADCRVHEPGALVLGSIDDAGVNLYALSQAPEKVRAFFRDSSFGILRPMAQNVQAFEEQLAPWAQKLSAALNTTVSTDFVKAKLCGRWPSGELMRPGETAPGGSLVLNLGSDGDGQGCPYGSHVRRMRAAPDRSGHVFERPLQRRSMPYGPAVWQEGPDGKPMPPDYGQARGLLGHFFCASIEQQFEHLLGQWAARPPLDFAPDDQALDPLIGPHENANAALKVPLKAGPTQYLQGFRACTTTLGTMYAWYPSRCALYTLLNNKFVPEEDEGPWL